MPLFQASAASRPLLPNRKLEPIALARVELILAGPPSCKLSRVDACKASLTRKQTAEPVEERHVGLLHIDIVTLFPEMFAPIIGLSIVGRAVERGLVNVRTHHLLDALEPGRRADERPYGGGPGMVLRIEPLAHILDAILTEAPAGERRKIVLTSASGPVFRQADAAVWAGLDRLVLICGHYEGVDERIRTLYPVEEVSLGEFVLTGGEIAAMAFLDAAVRLVPGAIDPDSAASESWTAGELDHPAYTRPPIFRGVDVPAVLLSGDHARIAEWRRQQSRARAAARARIDAEVAAAVRESAEEDRELTAEFECTLNDGEW